MATGFGRTSSLPSASEMFSESDPIRNIVRTKWSLGFLKLPGSFPKLGVPFWGGPHIKDYSILGSILGYPNFAKVPLGLVSNLKASCLV